MPELQVETNRLLRGFSANLLFKLLGFVAAFFFQIYYARVLGAKNLGDLGIAVSVITFGILLCNFGMDTALTRFAPTYRSSSCFDVKLMEFFGFTLRMALLFSALACAGIFFLRHRLSEWISPSSDISLYLTLLCPLLLLTAAGMQVGGALRASERFVEYSFNNDFLPLFSLGFFFLIIHLLLGLDVMAYILAYTIGGMLSLGLGISWLQRGPITPLLFGKWHLKPEERKHLISFGVKTLVYSLLVTSMTQTARILLGVFGRNSEAGIIVVVETLSIVLISLQASIVTVFMPQISRLYGEGKKNILFLLYKRLSRWSLITCLPYAVVFVLNAKEVISLYGSQFSSGQSALVVLIAAQFIVVMLGLNGSLLYMTGYENVVVLSEGICLGSAVTLGVHLVPRYGAYGAAMATGFSLVLTHVIRLATVVWIFKATQFSLQSLRTLAAGGFLFLLVWFGKGYINLGSAPINLLVKVALAYAAFSLLVLSIDRREEDMEVLVAAKGWLQSHLLSR